MRAVSCVMMLVLVSAVIGQEKSKDDEPKPGAAKEVVISLADTPKIIGNVNVTSVVSRFQALYQVPTYHVPGPVTLHSVSLLNVRLPAA